MKKLSPVETIRLVNLVARPEKAIFQSRLGSLSAPLLRSGPFMVSSSLSPTEAGALSKKTRSATAVCALLSGLTLASVCFALFSSDAEPPHATSAVVATSRRRMSALRMLRRVAQRKSQKQVPGPVPTSS